MNEPPNFDLDQLMTIPEAAAWIKVTERKLRDWIADRTVPAIRFTRNEIRIHPRTVLALWAKGQGLNAELMNALYGYQVANRNHRSS